MRRRTDDTLILNLSATSLAVKYLVASEGVREPDELPSIISSTDWLLVVMSEKQ